MGKKPLIGLSSSWAPFKKGRVDMIDPEFDYLKSEYSEAIIVAGGIPIIIPTFKKSHLKALDQIIPLLDGLVLTGGCDLDPSFFGEMEIPDAKCVIRKRRDILELELAKKFDELSPEKPLLAICRGHQLFNVYLGGTLIQDFDACGKKTIPQKHSLPKERTYHEVEIFPGTLLSSIIGEGTHTVNSSHHQGIAKLAVPLKIVAKAPDGIIEAVEMKKPRRWFLSIQWHPEAMVGDKASKEIFKAFVKACL
jgi:putative glutamine amidotransferase